jgi:rhodanese-related sulfurtransferase
MPSPTEITVAQLSRLVGLPDAPVIIDVRDADAYRADPRLLPAALRQDSRDVETLSKRYAGRSIVTVCQRGGAPSQALAAWLRHEGLDAQTLEGGHEAWCKDNQLLFRSEKLPPRDSDGRTVWVTRARPKVDRIACPWLIRRFVDPHAVFLYVPPAEVAGVADHAKATPFDVEGAMWSDRGTKTTFDVMLTEFGLDSAPLSRLAAIVRGADTGKVELTQQSAGLLALCLGYSRMYRDDLAQLEAALGLFDALYRWSRDATEERHG